LLILLTNDDGIFAEGLTTLRDYLLKSHEVFAVAPERERTCTAHAITLHKPLRMREVGAAMYSTNGTPVDAVLLGIKGLLPRKPDFVISGINMGPNMGQDVNYSGTVAAAKEGAFFGIPSLAVSLSARGAFLFTEAARVTGEVLERLSRRPLLESTFLNVNIPNLPFEEVKGFVVTRLGKRIYNDLLIERVDPRGGKYYWIGGNGDNYEAIEGSDFSAVDGGYVSITPIDLDTTSEGSLDYYRTFAEK
jgi:5'-nucleotidase